MKYLDLIPGWVWALVVAALVVFSGMQSVGKANAKREVAELKMAVAQATNEAQAQARKAEQRMQTEVERIAKDEEAKRKVLAVRVARADAAVASLRDEIGRLNARPAPANPESAAYAGEASAARELLGACSDEYRLMARQAEELRIQVIGLQDYIRSIRNAIR